MVANNLPDTRLSIKHQVLLAHGQEDTLIKFPGRMYEGITASQIAEMVVNPQCVTKDKASFIIPSEYRHHDGRSHDMQRRGGRFRYLCFDIDTGNHTLDFVRSSFAEIFGEAGMMIYSSSRSSEETKKWRVIVPLKTAIIGGEDYKRATTEVLIRIHEKGIELDEALTRCGQPVFLPNVPPDRRNPDGTPIFYQHLLHRAPPFEYYESDIEQAAEAKRRAEEYAAEQAAVEREQRLAKRAAERQARGNDVEPVEEFNARHSIADMLDRYGYLQQGRSDQYRSPQQTTKSYAVKNFETHWVSLSGSDLAAGIGQQKSGYCWGDAFDLFCFYEHGNDMKAAVRAYGAELRAPQFTAPQDPLDDFEIVQRPINNTEKPDRGADRDTPNEISSAPKPNEISQPEPASEISSDADWELPDTDAQPPEPQHWPTMLDQFDETLLPRREWIYGYDYIRKFVSVLASAGGIGKTSLTVVEALAICTGKALLNTPVKQQCNVWVVNLEDPRSEIEMRTLAAMRHYQIPPEDVRGKLFIDGEDTFTMTLAAEGRDGVQTNDALLNAMTKKIKENDIGVVIIDPFVSTHLVNENSNSGIQAVVAMIRKLARDTNASISLVHHVRKGNGDDATIDSVRGAGALIGAARAARVINRITEDDALRMGVDEKAAKGIFRVDDGKANLAPPADKAVYRRMIGVQIDNEEWIGVCVPFDMPDAFDGITTRLARKCQDIIGGAMQNEKPYRQNSQANNWAGHAIAHTLGIDTSDKPGKTRMSSIIKTWIASDVLRVEEIHDARTGRDVPFLTVGTWINPEDIG